MKKNFHVILFALLGMLFLNLSSAAQTAFTLRGQVVDETDAVIPGATVTLTTADGKTRTVTSDATGAFAVPQLATGIYQVTAAFDGFQPYLQSGLQLAATNAPLKIVLKVAEVSITTTISAEDPADTTDPTKNQNATVLDEETIQQIVPDNEDDMQSFLQGLAGGQNAQVYVDGFTGGRLPPRDSIMQIRVNQNPFTAEFSQPGMGRVEIITKPGRDQWRGSFGFNFRNSALDARNAFAVTKPDLNQNRYQFNLSGPIIAKKMSFFMNAERRALEGSNNVVARTLDGTFTANVKAPNTSTFFNLRTDYLLNDKNTLNVSYNRFGNSSINREFAARFGGGGFGGGFGGPGGGGGFGGGVSGTSYLLPERGSNADSVNQTLQLGETMIINPKLILETRLRFIRESRNTTAESTGVAINVLDAFNGGGATCCPSSTRENNLEWQEYLTWTHKQHTVKGGTQLMRYSINDITSSNFNGTYTFSSLDQYRAVINGERDANGNLIRPTQFTISQGDPRLQFTQYQGASFIQDDWRVKPNLTLSLGLRHEFQSQLSDANNFAPRVGLAWSPDKGHKTTVRIGGGIFYSRLTDNLYSNVLRYDGTRQQSFIIRNPAWPNALDAVTSLDPARTIRRVLDSQLAAPYSVNFNAAVERQLPLGFVITTTYMFNRGIHQFRSRNINALRPETGLRPDPTQGNIYQIESSALSQSHGLMVGVQRRMGKRFQVFSNYTLSRTMSNSDSALSVPANNYDLSSEWGRSQMDRRHTLFVGGTINLPQGIRLSPFVTASSGSPFNITTGADDNLDTEINDRPAGLSRNGNLLPSMYSLLSPSLQNYLTTYYPNGVNANGPGAFNVNLSVAKTFSFGERKNANAASAPQGGPRGGGMRGGPMGGGMFGGGETGRFNVQLSAQITNLLNRVNYGAYSGVLSSPYFAQANSASGARQLEIGLRFSF